MRISNKRGGAAAPPHSRCVYFLWAIIQIIVGLAGICWLLFNVAVMTGFLRGRDSLSPSDGEFGSSGHSSSGTDAPQQQVRHEPSSFSKNSQDSESKKSGNSHGGTRKILEYAAEGGIRPGTDGQYYGAQPGRMHGLLGIIPATGNPVYVPDKPPSKNLDVTFALAQGGGFNLYLSDHLPLDRPAPDFRPASCSQQLQVELQHFKKEQQQRNPQQQAAEMLKQLPKASVVMVFYNESFSTLLRSVHSVLNHTPPDWLEEIVLVDDGSTLDYIRNSSSGFFEQQKQQQNRQEAASPTAKTTAGDRQVRFDGELGDAAFLDLLEEAGIEEEEKEEEEVLQIRRRQTLRHQQQPVEQQQSVLRTNERGTRGTPNYRRSPTLVEYLQLLPEKVKLVRNANREGIVKARLRGIQASKAPIFVVLDSHIEVEPQWLEPLVLRIAGDRRRVVMPQVNGIEADTFEMTAGGIGCRLGFLWRLVEHSFEDYQLSRMQRVSLFLHPNKIPQPSQTCTASSALSSLHDTPATEPNRNSFLSTGATVGGEDAAKNADSATPADAAAAAAAERCLDEAAAAAAVTVARGIEGGLQPQISPTMAGGLFAANKEFFFEIGGYDEGFQYWGAENLELSFRLWQCGGELECSACSQVHHIFRKGGGGYSVPADALTANKMRTLLWMDEFADLVWRIMGKPLVPLDWTTFQQRRHFKQRHKCRSFRWYLQNIYPESDILTLEDVPFLGPIKNIKTGFCLDQNYSYDRGQAVVLRPCNGSEYQDFMYFRKTAQLMPVRDDESCLDASGRWAWCKGQPTTRWEITSTGMIRHVLSKTCLSGYGHSIHIVECDDTDLYQSWTWTTYEAPKVFKYPHEPTEQHFSKFVNE